MNSRPGGEADVRGQDGRNQGQVAKMEQEMMDKTALYDPWIKSFEVALLPALPSLPDRTGGSLETHP